MSTYEIFFKDLNESAQKRLSVFSECEQSIAVIELVDSTDLEQDNI